MVGGVEGIGVSGTGTFTQNSGTNYIIGGGTGSGQLGNTGISFNSASGALVLGWYNGSYTSSRGHYYYQGYGVGTYNLNGGDLTGNDPSGGYYGGLEVVGYSGTGIFNHTGGTNNAVSLFVGGGGVNTQFALQTAANPAYGTYSLSNGLLTTVYAENLGNAGTGIFTQTGGTNLVGWGINLGGNSNLINPTGGTNGPQPGTYNLAGGLLQVGSIGQTIMNGAGPASFNFTGGTLQAAGPGKNPWTDGVSGLTLATAITVGTAASNVATLDANGYTVAVNPLGGFTIGYLTGPGQLRVIDSRGGGVVVLGGTDSNGIPIPNSYTGGTTVLSGTLQVLNNQALPSTGILTVAGPATVVFSAI